VSRRLVLRNFFALSGVQIVNYLVPIVVVPLSLKIVGLEQFGRVVLLQSIIWILTSVVEYGFPVSGARQIAWLESKIDGLSKIVSHIMLARLYFFIAVGVIMILATLSIYRNWLSTTELMVVMLGILGNTINPSWFHHGIQRMEFIAFWNAISKVVYLIAIIFLVRAPSDYLLIIGLYGLINVLVSGVILRFIYSRYELTFLWPTWYDIKYQFKIALPLFVPSIGSAIIIGANPIVLFLFSSGQNLGEFGVVEKVSIAFWQIASSFNQATFPQVCKLASCNSSAFDYKRFYFRIYLPFIIIFLSAITLISFFNHEVISLIFGLNNEIADGMLIKIIWVPFLIALNIPANQMLLAFSIDGVYNKIFLLTLIIYLISGIFLTINYSADGTIAAMIITQFCLTALLYLGFYQFTFLNFRNNR